MTNVTRREYDAVFSDPEDFTKAELELMPDYPNSGKVGLCMFATDTGRHTVVIGVKGEDDMRALLYEMAVQSKLIKDGETLTLDGKVDDGQENCSGEGED